VPTATSTAAARRNDNQFQQWGVGVECLTKWVDARANYYFGDDDQKLAKTRTDVSVSSSYSTSTAYTDLYGTGNSIMQGRRADHHQDDVDRDERRFKLSKRAWKAGTLKSAPSCPSWRNWQRLACLSATKASIIRSATI